MADDAKTSEALLVACPADGTLNRIPREKLGEGAKCGRCHAPLFEGRPLILTAANYEKHAVRSDLPLLIDFWAAWCGPCRMMAPAFEAAAAQLEPRMRLAKLDTEAEPEIAGRYAVRSIPSLILVRHGRELARTAGAMPAASIVHWAEQALGR